ncbi:MAG: prolyl oligopeptidase family serine peptidase [Candidatus Binatota bacterium]|nr:prolyl oligopeptidase family serine peptidase [Candidatus Binatota bacterium]
MSTRYAINFGSLAFLTASLGFFLLTCGITASAEPEEVKFASDKLMLHGFLYNPEGNGPFPAILYNHGSERKPGAKPDLGKFFSAKGYVFFVPHRLSHGRSPNNSQIDSLYDQGARSIVTLHEFHLGDQLAALSYLKQRSYVETSRIAVAGCSYGGIQTVLAVESNAEQNLGLRAAVNFAGAAQSWRASSSLRDRLIRAVRKATIPIMFVQAENDYDLTPSRVLSAELQQLGKPNRLAIFPPYGNTREEGHGGFCFGGTNVWGDEVLSFLESHLGK